MVKYVVEITKRVQKQLDKLDDNIAEPIFDAIENLADDPRPFGYIKLKGREGYRIRVGNYRIIYEIFDAVLLVVIADFGNRKDIYD